MFWAKVERKETETMNRMRLHAQIEMLDVCFSFRARSHFQVELHALQIPP